MTDKYIYNLRNINEDTNPWDGNISYGMFDSLEKAQEAGIKDWYAEEENLVWAPTEGTYCLNSESTYVKSWQLVEPDRVEEDGTCCSDFGLVITQERLN